jgi:5'(3')-deoxyribonucleotidase
VKKIVYIDMDDTIADFKRDAKCHRGNFFVEKMYETGFFLNLKPVDGAQLAVRSIINMGYDVWILTQPLAENADSYTEKAQWVSMWFPELYSKIIMTQNKGLHLGHYLIDDNEAKWKNKFEASGGKFIHFEYEGDHRLSWSLILDFFKQEIATKE